MCISINIPSDVTPAGLTTLRSTRLQKPRLQEGSLMPMGVCTIQLCPWILVRLSPGGREDNLLGHIVLVPDPRGRWASS